jgi:SH3-like domain-containing protein
VTGLPVPRYVSLKSDRVHVRQGPGTDYKVLWVFQRVGLPVEVIREFEAWREIRDSEGATGWVLQSLLSGRRSGLVVNWDAKRGGPPSPHQRLPIRPSARDSGETVAMVEPGVIANVLSCDGTWCRISVGAVNGYIRQNQLWGVYEGESIR